MRACRGASSNNALQLTSSGPMARASRAPSLMRCSQLNAVLDRQALTARH
jgi:hypothetical protein